MSRVISIIKQNRVYNKGRTHYLFSVQVKLGGIIQGITGFSNIFLTVDVWAG